MCNHSFVTADVSKLPFSLDLNKTRNIGGPTVFRGCWLGCVATFRTSFRWLLVRKQWQHGIRRQRVASTYFPIPSHPGCPGLRAVYSVVSPRLVRLHGIVMSISVHMYTSVLSPISKTTWLNFTKFSVHVSNATGSVLQQHCGTLCISGFVNNVVFSHCGPVWMQRRRVLSLCHSSIIAASRDHSDITAASCTR